MTLTAYCLSLTFLWTPVNPNGAHVSQASFCIPRTVRYTKCVEQKEEDCIRERKANCKTRLRCVRTGRFCSPLSRN